MKDWYFDNNSVWTLDYPPFFAYFEWMLYQISQFIDSQLIQVKYIDAIMILLRIYSIFMLFVLMISNEYLLLEWSVIASFV